LSSTGGFFGEAAKALSFALQKKLAPFGIDVALVYPEVIYQNVALAIRSSRTRGSWIADRRDQNNLRTEIP